MVSSKLSVPRFVFGLLTLHLFFHGTFGQCYYPDGSIPTDYIYVPCGGLSGHSSCCIPKEGDLCLSNGLCYWPGGDYPFRGACTDQSWKDGKCSPYCQKSKTGGWEKLESCGGTKYCCSSGGSACCNKPNLVFDIGTPAVINDYGASSPSSTSSNKIITASSLATSSPTPADPTATDAGAQSGSAAPSTSAGATPSSSDRSSFSKSAIIGIACGIVTVVVAASAGLLAYVCARARANKKQARHLQHALHPQPGQQPFVAAHAAARPPLNPPMDNLIDVGSNDSALSSLKGSSNPHSPMSAYHEPAPPYKQGEYCHPYQHPPMGSDGAPLIELHSLVGQGPGYGHAVGGMGHGPTKRQTLHELG